MKRKVTLISTAVFLVVVLSLMTTLLLIKNPVGAKSVIPGPVLDTTIDKMEEVRNQYLYEDPVEVGSLMNTMELDWYFESADKRRNYLCYYEEYEFFEVVFRVEEIQSKDLNYSG